MKLLIVESPTKSKTIKKFLGKNFEVASCYGHIRDLPKHKLGVDVDNNFKPKYVVPKNKKSKVKELKSKAQKAGNVILGVDEDREGEAIAWHLSQVLGIKGAKRIVFHEITKGAILEALKNPRGIDMNLVNAQQARRILDRLVGYKLSPFLWKKVMRGLSAGRVQSVAVRLICEREKEIEEFKPKEYWTITAELSKSQIPNSKLQTSAEYYIQNFKALLIKKGGKKLSKFAIKNKQQAQEIIKELDRAEYQVAKVEKKELQRHPAPPFITSTLQRTAAQRLRLSAKQIMFLAQSLYEKGLITYHRTDSVNLSAQFLNQAAAYIKANLGPKYSKPCQYKTKAKSAQEAHEAIRPTKASLENLNNRKFNKLYRLIWQRAIASQMTPALFDTTKVEIDAGKYTLQSNGQTMKFDGFMRVYPVKFKQEQVPPLRKGEPLDLKLLKPEQHFTRPPARYSEADLVKVLEKEGIGRPSTYALILDTIQSRRYVKKNDKKRFFPTNIGKLVNELLVKNFPNIVDPKFTANMEDNLDQIAEGKKEWVEILNNFYTPFMNNLQQKEKDVPKKDLTESTDKKCPECKGKVVIRLGRYGKFYACSNFPDCKWTKNLPPKKTGVKCPQCPKGEIVVRKTKRGKTFYGCNQWPECDFALWDKPVNKKCPECGSLLVEKGKNKKITCSNQNCNR